MCNSPFLPLPSALLPSTLLPSFPSPPPLPLSPHPFLTGSAPLYNLSSPSTHTHPPSPSASLSPSPPSPLSLPSSLTGGMPACNWSSPPARTPPPPLPLPPSPLTPLPFLTGSAPPCNSSSPSARTPPPAIPPPRRPTTRTRRATAAADSGATWPRPRAVAPRPALRPRSRRSSDRHRSILSTRPPILIKGTVRSCFSCYYTVLIDFVLVHFHKIRQICMYPFCENNFKT